MEDNEVTDLSYLRELAMGDDSIVIETAETFIGDTPTAISNIEEAYQKEDWDKLYKQAHKIKPSLTYMGMERAGELIIDIEQQAQSNNVRDGLEQQLEEFKQLCQQALEELSAKVEQLKE